MERYDGPDIVNIGTGEDLTIRELAERVRGAVGYGGELAWDAARPDGTLRKLLNISFLHGLGWRHTVELDEGLRRTYAAFLSGKRREF